MYYVDDFLASIKVSDRLPDYRVTGMQSSGMIDGSDYRVSIYAHPENMCTTYDKISGHLETFWYGVEGAEELKDCVEGIVSRLESVGY